MPDPTLTRSPLAPLTRSPLAPLTRVRTLTWALRETLLETSLDRLGGLPYYQSRQSLALIGVLSSR
jgi:hypothetical protein